MQLDKCIAWLRDAIAHYDHPATINRIGEAAARRKARSLCRKLLACCVLRAGMSWYGVQRLIPDIRDDDVTFIKRFGG